MRGTNLTVVDHETDIGIITQKNLRPGLPCKEAAKKLELYLVKSHLRSLTETGIFL